MSSTRIDNRAKDPTGRHKAAFMAGWTEAAEKGLLYETVRERKTHANMGNLFGWIFGVESGEFRDRIWEIYLESSFDGISAQGDSEAGVTGS